MPFTFLSVEESSDVLNARYNTMSIDTRGKIWRWQNGDANATPCIENEAAKPQYRECAKGFGGITSSVFKQIVDAVGSGDAAAIKRAAPTVLHYDDQCVCFLPAGPRNTTLLTANPTSWALGGASGASSHMHVLVIPRTPIYNAATLTPAHAPLIQHMERVGRHVVCQLAVADSFRADKAQPSLPDVPGWNGGASLLETNKFDYDGYLPYGFNLHPTAARDLLGSDGDNVHAFFQVHPDNSIGYLHMHMIPMPLVSRAGGNTYFADHRNMPVAHVLAHLEKLSKLEGGRRAARKQVVAPPKWLPTSRTVTLKGASRKLWRSAKDASVLAVKRIVKAADGSRKVRFEKV